MKIFIAIVLLFLSSNISADINKANSIILKHEELSKINEQDNVKYLLNGDNSALAICYIQNPNKCYILNKKTLVDVSQMENANLGKLGLRKRNEYEKILSIPEKWEESNNGVYLVWFKTQAWRNGQRYTVKEPVYVENGIYNVR